MWSKDLPKAPVWLVAGALEGTITWVNSVLCPCQPAPLAGTAVQCAFLAQAEEPNRCKLLWLGDNASLLDFEGTSGFLLGSQA